MMERCINGMSAYVLLDCYKLLSDMRCRKLGLPAGSLFAAKETVRNLQSCALGMLGVCLSKNKSGNPFLYGHHRLCELGIEEHFGRLRSQSASAQLTCRAFWKAASRDMLHSANDPKRTTPPIDDVLEPISSEDFAKASLIAFNAAIQLVSWTSGYSTDQVSKLYREWCDGHSYAVEDPLLGDEEECEENIGFVKGQNVNAPVQPSDVLRNMADEAGLEGELTSDPQSFLDFELTAVPDAASLKSLFVDVGDDEDDEGSTIAGTPHTLHQALAPFSQCPTEVEMFDRLWRLLMWCRYWGGVETLGGSRTPRPLEDDLQN